MIRTDLALEKTEELPNLGGVRREEIRLDGFVLERVTVFTPEAAQALGKPEGRYLSLHMPRLPGEGQPLKEETRAAARALAELLPPEGPVLVLGLGNRDITPDALGPMAARQVLATRHLPRQSTLEFFQKLRQVIALAPGVMAQTGLEAGELAAAVTAACPVAAVVAIDALACRSPERLGRTLQLCDTGIHPGSGVHNRRAELSRRTLGVPVIGVGLPTVTDWEENEGMMVTPKEIDLIIRRAAALISGALNAALQPSLTPEDLSALTAV